jgi:formylglycine-generating enzyme required for sulfatase activity
MVVVPAGSFTMGSPWGEKDQYKDEWPQHIVMIGTPFAVGKLHVTRDQFAAFIRERGYQINSKCSESLGDRSWRNPGFAQDGSHPVVCVSWNDAGDYADWLANKTGKPYRLLSEAEWEYAARGRTSPGNYPRFWFGDNEKDLCRYGNFWDNRNTHTSWLRQTWAKIATVFSSTCNDEYERTSPAGHYEPNVFGLYDMAGNAWQWTADCYHDSHSGAPSDGSAWTAENCLDHVNRGGSWYEDPRDLRAAVRGRAHSQYSTSGFRLARTLTP